MAAFGKKLRTAEGEKVLFQCPGCKMPHVVSIGEGEGPRWGFNGDPDAPTFRPSILVQGFSQKFDKHGRWTGDWVRDAGGDPIPQVCHSFVQDGRIQFLNDCTHSMAGRVVDLPDWGYEQ